MRSRLHRATAPASLLCGALLLTGCGSDGSDAGSDDSATALTVSGAYMPQPVSASMAAGFLTITNSGDVADELTSVTSDLGEVTVHQTVDGAMREVESLEIPAHGELALESGGDHLMFESLERRPEEGQTVALELRFAHGDPVTVRLPVKAATYRPTGHGSGSAEPSESSNSQDMPSRETGDHTGEPVESEHSAH
ncbi:copper chaperone PCu(A)C [Streptomyces sp. ZYX-F-203]